MNSAPIVPAALAFDAQGRQTALLQARDVFLAGNELPQRWRGRDRFVVLDTGFGTGDNFLAAWQAWRNDAQRCTRLVFISIEQHPLSGDALTECHRASPLPMLAAELQRAWPPPTHNLHRLSFDDGAVELLLAFGAVQVWLPELVAEIDAFFLGGCAPCDHPQTWDARFCKAIGRLAAPGATLASRSAAHALRAHLASAGFNVQPAHDEVGKRNITLARFAPAFVPRRAVARSRSTAASNDRHALIIGAGLAGCAAASALAGHGWRSTVLECQALIASGASGNLGGLFHGIVNAQDGVHARFNRAAALAAHGAVKSAVARGVAGNASGLLRLETTLDATAMRALLRRLGLPPGYVQALSAADASERAGVALASPCWFYPGGGWVQPAGLAAAFLEQAGVQAELRAASEASRLERTTTGWRVLDARGDLMGEAGTVVLANAFDAQRLLRASNIGADWPLESVRGQISIASAAHLASPRLPIAGRGYLLPAIDGRVMFGATAQPADADRSVRDADHLLNVAQLARLLGHAVDLPPAELAGRTAWRCSAVDRLPLIGAVPDPDAVGARLDQPRFVPRLAGLYVFTALGSRGITWCALGAQVLAAAVTGAPAPIEASLLDAIDPARFVSRRARRAASTSRE